MWCHKPRTAQWCLRCRRPHPPSGWHKGRQPASQRCAPTGGRWWSCTEWSAQQALLETQPTSRVPSVHTAPPVQRCGHLREGSKAGINGYLLEGCLTGPTQQPAGVGCVSISNGTHPWQGLSHRARPTPSPLHPPSHPHPLLFRWFVRLYRCREIESGNQPMREARLLLGAKTQHDRSRVRSDNITAPHGLVAPTSSATLLPTMHTTPGHCH